MRPPLLASSPSGKKETSIFKRVMTREMSVRANRECRKKAGVDKFQNFALQAELDTHDPETCELKIPFLRKRARVVEIVSAKDLVFGLTQTGVCAAFNRRTKRRVCFLNIVPDEIIRSLFYNKVNDSIITVSVYRTDNFSSLKCRSTPIEYVRRAMPDATFPLFESESLRWPGFVEFDDVNSKVLTYSADNKVYTMWDLINYKPLYRITDTSIQEIKIGPGVMLVIYQRVGSHIPLKLRSIETGEILTSFQHLIHRNKKVDFIEQFNEKLLVKQENENLQIYDVWKGELKEVERQQFSTPSAFIFLYENQLFLTFKNRNVAVWNSRGELVTKFENHTLYHPDCNTNNIYITSQQDTLISYCRNGNASVGSINISSILNGKSLARITADKSGDMRVHHALCDVTAIYYNEEENELYSGTRSGMIHIWSN